MAWVGIVPPSPARRRPSAAARHVPGVVEDGRVGHRRGVTDVAGLYFLGLSW